MEGCDRYAERMVNAAHPLSVALGEVVVDGHDVDAAAGEGVQVGGQGGCESLALSRLHLGDLALVEHDAAHDLDVEVAQTERSLGCLADGGERLGADVVKVFALGKQGLELIGLGPQGVVGELFEFGLPRSGGVNVRTEALEDPVASAGDEVCHSLQHGAFLPQARPNVPFSSSILQRKGGGCGVVGRDGDPFRSLAAVRWRMYHCLDTPFRRHSE